nr:cupin domain-containing protein [uncultured Albidiferax sp.]
MQPEDFAVTLAQEGFQPPLTITREPNGHMGTHTHAFEAKALVLSGELSITVDGVDNLYEAGQVFHLRAQVPHAEQYGPQGVEYMVGRK